ncbi:DUF2956 domain-containing protein [Vibrio sp.]|nr:DUF2956 domain-containing protein [Vibrio sp.]
MKNKSTPSPQTQQEAIKIAKATQKPGQTKEQTRLIAQGIEKGIALYKKQQKEKKREFEKQKKKGLRVKQSDLSDSTESQEHSQLSTPKNTTSTLPWWLLSISWLSFLGYIIVYLK